MIFSSLLFLYAFLPALLILYYIVKNDTYRRIVLLAFSLLFYAWGEPRHLLLMLGITLVAYIFGRLIGKTDGAAAKMYSASAITIIIATLAFFKYTNFLVDTINILPGVSIKCSVIGLPIGISFFSFQAMSYVIDVYRKDAAPQNSYGKLLLYISLFPQLIAGPIVRYKDIEFQMDNRRVSAEDINEGIWRLAVGLGKKVIIANTCGAAGETLMNVNGDVSLLSRWVCALFFGFQLYYDFSGYSDMAIGLGRMFGFKFCENFNYPFSASSAGEYWRRWHISLSSFFRDYLYIPLGGNRKHYIRNIFIVWLLTGMWHGASWNFILWGLYYGALIVLEKYVLLPLGEKLPKAVNKVVFKIYFIFITLLGMGFFFFEEDLFKNIGYMFGKGTVGLSDIFTNSVLSQNIWLLIAAAAFSLPLAPLVKKLLLKAAGGRDTYAAERIVKTALALVIITVCTMMIAGNSYNPFLYYRF